MIIQVYIYRKKSTRQPGQNLAKLGEGKVILGSRLPAKHRGWDSKFLWVPNIEGDHVMGLAAGWCEDPGDAKSTPKLPGEISEIRCPRNLGSMMSK